MVDGSHKVVGGLELIKGTDGLKDQIDEIKAYSEAYKNMPTYTSNGEETDWSSYKEKGNADATSMSGANQNLAKNADMQKTLDTLGYTEDKLKEIQILLDLDPEMHPEKVEEGRQRFMEMTDALGKLQQAGKSGEIGDQVVWDMEAMMANATELKAMFDQDKISFDTYN
jgi:hypothetical protein